MYAAGDVAVVAEGSLKGCCVEEPVAVCHVVHCFGAVDVVFVGGVAFYHYSELFFDAASQGEECAVWDGVAVALW